MTIQILDQFDLPLFLPSELITDLRIPNLRQMNQQWIDDPVGCKDHLSLISDHGVKCNRRVDSPASYFNGLCLIYIIILEYCLKFYEKILDM